MKNLKKDDQNKKKMEGVENIRKLFQTSGALKEPTVKGLEDEISEIKDFLALPKENPIDAAVVEKLEEVVKRLEQELSEAKAALEQAEVEYFATRDPCFICKREESVRKCFHCGQRYGLGCEIQK